MPSVRRSAAIFFGLALALAVARPLAAAPADTAAARGAALFFEHSFGGTPASVPLKVFEALPDLEPRFGPDQLKARYGLLFRPGRALPVGFVKASALGVERLSFNCSLCHTGQLAGALVPGLPNRQLRMQAFEEDMLGSLARHAPLQVLGAVQRRNPWLSPYEALQLRLWLTLAHSKAQAYKPSPYRAGPGRFDLLGSFKQRLGLPPHNFNAQMDIPALFGAKTLTRYPRDGALGGDQDLVRYLIVRLSGDNSPLVNGQVPPWVKDLNAYLATLEPPRYPYAIDARKAHRGQAIFANVCAGCHGTYEPGHLKHSNLIIPIDVVGTDPNRVQVWDEAARAYARRDPIMSRLDLKMGVGMMPASLRGVWATSPYLHNGSAPTLHDVLGDPAKRPESFFRGGDAFDPVNVGIPPRSGSFFYDTRLSGNHNTGHPFAMGLAEDERMAVIEYLKTL